MQAGDILYSNVSSSPLVVLVRRGDGQYFDFAAGAFAQAVRPVDKARFCLPLVPDAILLRTRRVVIPAAASVDPQAELIEAIVLPDGSVQETQSYWIGGSVDTTEAGVPMAQARGAVAVWRFTG